jgi:hypothetical protein
MYYRNLLSALILACAAACARAPQPATTPDPRVGLKPGMADAGVAAGNAKLLANVPRPSGFEASINSDIAFLGNYAVQGNYNGILIYDISTPSNPRLVTSVSCPASQNDVSVYRNLLFVSSEGTGGRLDCQGGGVRDTVSPLRMRGVRIFDISDIRSPKLVSQVQTCRGSHTHTVLEDPKDRDNVYVYVSGSAGIRSPNELPGCVREVNDPSSAYFRIEVIKVPLANPAQAAVVSSPRFFEGLAAPPEHGAAIADLEAERRRVDSVKRAGGFVYVRNGVETVGFGGVVRNALDSIVKARGGTGIAQVTSADSAQLRRDFQRFMDQRNAATAAAAAARPNPLAGRGPTQCHDITVYPAIGLAGGACEGYGFLLDISDPVNPRRVDQVADSNFSYWHSATFNNDGSKILFSDEWGGGNAAKCRATDPKEWGANALFTIENRKMTFRSYYKLPAVQAANEICVAHNGSLVPIPDRDVMVQAWYEGGVSVFDWTDAAHPKEIAYFDRGPADSARFGDGGPWSTYWYNGAIYSSEIGRGLDVIDLLPSEHLTQNEIDAAKTVRLPFFNAQGQPRFIWPPSFALARAYVDQLERSKCVNATRIAQLRSGLQAAEAQTGVPRRETLLRVASDAEGSRSACAPKIGKLATTARALAGLQP